MFHYSLVISIILIRIENRCRAATKRVKAFFLTLGEDTLIPCRNIGIPVKGIIGYGIFAFFVL